MCFCLFWGKFKDVCSYQMISFSEDVLNVKLFIEIDNICLRTSDQDFSKVRRAKMATNSSMFLRVFCFTFPQVLFQEGMSFFYIQVPLLYTFGLCVSSLFNACTYTGYIYFLVTRYFQYLQISLNYPIYVYLLMYPPLYQNSATFSACFYQFQNIIIFHVYSGEELVVFVPLTQLLLPPTCQGFNSLLFPSMPLAFVLQLAILNLKLIIQEMKANPVSMCCLFLFSALLF